MTTSSSMREAIRGIICVDTVRFVEGPNVPVEGRATMTRDKLKSFAGASPRAGLGVMVTI